MGDLVETAVYSQWFHSDTTTLHYARWGNGEVDMVYLGPDQRVTWAMETKWSDRYFEKPNELKSLCSFCHANNIDRAAVTSISKEGVELYKNIKFIFRPAALHAYMVGANLIMNKQLKAAEFVIEGD